MALRVTGTSATSRRRICCNSSISAGKSKTSRKHSRYVSKIIGKRWILAGDAQQIRRSTALRPQRRAALGIALGQQQAPSCILAKMCRK